MPCHDPYAEATFSPEFYRARDAADQIAINTLKERLNIATRLLCESMTTLDRLKENGAINGYSASSELMKWWEEHKEYDRTRNE